MKVLYTNHLGLKIPESINPVCAKFDTYSLAILQNQGYSYFVFVAKKGENKFFSFRTYNEAIDKKSENSRQDIQDNQVMCSGNALTEIANGNNMTGVMASSATQTITEMWMPFTVHSLYNLHRKGYLYFVMEKSPHKNDLFSLEREDINISENAICKVYPYKEKSNANQKANENTENYILELDEQLIAHTKIKKFSAIIVL